MRGRLLSVERLLAGLVLAIGMSTPLDAQCAMCRRVLESGEGRALVEVLRQAILLLLITPFVLVGVIGTLAVRMQRRPPAPER